MSRDAARNSEQRSDVEPIWRERIAAAVAPHGQLKAIADAAGMSSPQLQKIANGTTKDPGLVTLTRIADAMGYTLVDLLAEGSSSVPAQVLDAPPGDEQNRSIPNKTDYATAVSAMREASKVFADATNVLRDITAGALLALPRGKTPKTRRPRTPSRKRS